MIFVPLPRRVGPTAKPPFSRSRRLHPRTPRPDSTCLAHTDAAPANSAPLPISRFAPIAEICGGKSGMEDTSPVTRAIAPRYPAPKTPHLAQSACHATDDRDYPTDALHAAPVRQPTTVLRLTPNVPPYAIAEKHRATPECTKRQPQMFMRLVLVRSEKNQRRSIDLLLRHRGKPLSGPAVAAVPNSIRGEDDLDISGVPSPARMIIARVLSCVNDPYNLYKTPRLCNVI